MLGFADGSFMKKWPEVCDGKNHAWQYDTPGFRTCSCGIQEAYDYKTETWKDVTER